MNQPANAKPEVLQIVQRLVEGNELSEADSQTFFQSVVAGEVDEILLAAALSAFKVRTQTASELAGAAKALLESATVYPRPDYPFIDVVGTGGDGFNTINLSTIAAITAAACGCKVIKHGNRSISSVSGSFDFLEKLSVNFNITPDESQAQVDQHGLCFLFAPNYHSGVRHATNVRKTLKVRTIFNLLGPLVNPARPPHMLLGVADPDLLNPMATVLSRLGCEHAFVVHGSGLDEVAIHGPTSVVEVKGESLNEFELSPESFGAESHQLDDLICHDAEKSHARSQAALEGQGNPAENAAVCVNVALMMSLFGNDDLKNNYSLAMDCLLKGQPIQLVSSMVENQPSTNE